MAACFCKYSWNNLVEFLVWIHYDSRYMFDSSLTARVDRITFCDWEKHLFSIFSKIRCTNIHFLSDIWRKMELNIVKIRLNYWNSVEVNSSHSINVSGSVAATILSDILIQLRDCRLDHTNCSIQIFTTYTFLFESIWLEELIKCTIVWWCSSGSFP